MVKVREDLTGKVFGRLTVLRQDEDYIDSKGNRFAKWLCECSCEEHNIVSVKQSLLKHKTRPTQSCGCISREKVSTIFSKENIFELNLHDEYGTYGIGYCTNTNSKFYFDMEDYETIKEHCWFEHIRGDGYHELVTKDRKTKKNVSMHAILGCKHYDHKDRNTLNNRKCNLRKATVIENNRNKSISKNNTSGIIGVSFNKESGMWHAQIGINKSKIHLGLFADKTDAIVARLKAEQKYFGEFAPQKHLYEQYGINESEIA